LPKKKMNPDAWRARVVRVITVWTALLHLPWAVAVANGLACVMGWWAAVLASGLWVVALLMPFCVVFDTIPDRPRSWWRVDLVEKPYLVHWMAVHLGVLGWVPGLIVGNGWPSLVAYGVGVLLFGWGSFVTARRLRVREVAVRVEGLPAAFEGYRIVHLTDLHVGSFTTPSRVARWFDRVREIGGDLVVVTGDLVTSGNEFHGAVVELMGRLRAVDGVFCVPGNHDYFGDGDGLFGQISASGVRVLCNESVDIARGGASITVAGVDDAWTSRMDVARSVAGRTGVIVLLAHDPVVFDEAVSLGVSVVLGGHTHGGQIALPLGFPGATLWLARHCNLTRFANRYSLGLYRKRGSTLVVSGGMGCTGVPVRVGVVPEVLVVSLVAA